MKGSKIGRFTKGKIYPGSVQKDLNLIEARGKVFEIKKHELSLKRQLRRDVAFLKKQGLIDYSLLVACEAKEKV